jgi:hypothetical protein
MSVDYASIANNSTLLATVLTPLLAYVNRENKTRFLDLIGVPFVIFLLAIVSSSVSPGSLSVVLFVFGVSVEILVYLMMAVENYYFAEYRLA